MTEAKPSKSERKRQFTELQQLGETLVTLTDAQLVKIVGDSRLIDAVREARAMNSHGALRRQKQLIGKIMRDIDAEPIRQAIDALRQQSRHASQVFKDAERWRDRLCDEGVTALAEYRTSTGTDDKALEDLLHEHASASQESARKAVSRQIFRHLHGDMLAKMQNSDR